MRTILALATAVLLFAPGCGDSSTTTDMQVTPTQDMSMMAVADMTASCQSILACAETCLAKADIVGCANTCMGKAATGSDAQKQFGALEQCLFSNCVLDASAQEIGGCVSTAIGTADSAGGCKDEAAACK